jgi:hypothetical protein
MVAVDVLAVEDIQFSARPPRKHRRPRGRALAATSVADTDAAVASSSILMRSQLANRSLEHAAGEITTGL